MVRRRHPAAADDFEEWTSGGPLSEPLSTPRGVSSMNRETEAVEKGKESELQGTGTVKLGTSDETKERQHCSGSHHSGAPDWGCDIHFLLSKFTDPELCDKGLGEEDPAA